MYYQLPWICRLGGLDKVLYILLPLCDCMLHIYMSNTCSYSIYKYMHVLHTCSCVCINLYTNSLLSTLCIMCALHSLKIWRVLYTIRAHARQSSPPVNRSSTSTKVPVLKTQCNLCGTCACCYEIKLTHVATCSQCIHTGVFLVLYVIIIDSEQETLYNCIV